MLGCLRAGAGDSLHVFGLDGLTAIGTCQLWRDEATTWLVARYDGWSCVSCHVLVAPVGERDDDGIEIPAFWCEAILKPCWTLFVADPVEHPFFHQLL